MFLTEQLIKRKILGTNKIIGSISRDEILAFHKLWYTPKNMVTVIVGDVNSKEVLPKVASSFGCNASNDYNTELLVTRENPKPINIKNRTIVEKADVDRGYMILGYPTVGNNNLKEAYALSIAASIFANGQNSILIKH